MKKVLLLINLALLTAGISQAQPLNTSTPEANLKAAQEAESNDNPYEALDRYQKVYDDGKEKAIAAKIAKMNYDLRDYEKAEKGFSKLVLRDRKAEYTELRYWLAMSMKHNGKYQDAIDNFTQYISDGADENLKKSAKIEIEGAKLAQKAKQPENLLLNNIGKKANSPQTEGSPSFNNGELYYASLQGKEVIVLDGKEGDWFSKVYTSTKSGTEFGEPKPLGEQINREGWHQGNVSVTADGKTMYFTRVKLAEKGQSMGESKIFYSTKGADGWSAANEVVGVNGDHIAKHPCEGELFGEKVLFFVANMPGGKGGFDLYYAPKKTDGVFGLPVNLGDVINTAGEEASPFYRDGKLYFSSNGRPTFGGFDVFETQWNGSVWSNPTLLPMGVNGALDDLYYIQTPDGMSGFFVSNRPGPNNLKSKTCCDDIYAWEIERIKVDLKALAFRRKTTKEKENPPLLNTTLQLQDVTDKNPKNVEEKTNASANNFDFTLVPDRSYRLIATHEGFQADTITFNTVGVKKSTTMEKKLTLRRQKPIEEEVIIKKDEAIVLDNILYDYDKWNIRPDAEPDLQYLTDIMLKYPEIKIELSSHTDSRGKDEYNETLSQKRAESARTWIISKGIAADRIVPKGYGEKQLKNKCANGVECTEEEHQANRRTEFKIISGPTSITVEKREKRMVDPVTGKPVEPKTTPPGGRQ